MIASSRRFAWHLLQMIVAMMIGMAVYVGLARLILAAEAYRARQLEQPLLWFAEMAVFMTVPMLALMRRHGYRWRQCVEMSAAMLIPPVALVLLVQGGVTAFVPWLSPHTLPASTHIAMLAGMLALMVYRHAEYTEVHVQHDSRGGPR